MSWSGQKELYEDMRTLQKVFVSIAFKEKVEHVILAERLDIELFRGICDRWRTLIRQEIQDILPNGAGA